MLVKVDWLSFTVKFPEGEGRTVIETAHLAALEIEELGEGMCERLHMAKGWIPSHGRAPYSHSFTWEDNGVTLFVHPNLNHALVEISGKGCDKVLVDDWAWDVLKPIMPRLTRIDIACDMLCETRPLEFTSQRETGRFKSHSEVVSESGETNYIGSKSSNRYARVYRYNAPHERSQLLRSEFVLKAEDAKATAQSIINDGLNAVSVTLGAQFGWQHPVWQPSASEGSELKVYRPDRREGKTLYWLNDTIAPLLLKLHRQGTVDVVKWFNENVFDKFDAEDMGRSGLIPF